MSSSDVGGWPAEDAGQGLIVHSPDMRVPKQLFMAIVMLSAWFSSRPWLAFATRPFMRGLAAATMRMRKAQHEPDASDDSACQRCCGERGSGSSSSATRDGNRPMCTWNEAEVS